MKKVKLTGKMVNSSSRNYYTLVVRHWSNLMDSYQWYVEFGDFDKEVVSEEMEYSFLDQGFKKKDLRVICTAESQEQIDRELRNLNLSERRGKYTTTRKPRNLNLSN